MTSTTEINDVLPQLQCRQCGFGGCKPYADALASGQAAIDRCLPGGVATLRKIARLLDQDPSIYERDIAQRQQAPAKAVIQHDACIGCRKCIDVCPQDAIIGAMNRNHAVLESACHGCGLCVSACPMDCVSMVDLAHAVSQERMAPIHQLRHEQLSMRRQRDEVLNNKKHKSAKRHGRSSKATKHNRLRYIQEARERQQSKSHEPKTTS